MKTKTIALLEILVVLCSVLIVALPAITADQTTQTVSVIEVISASGDDYVLEIYGNANEDDTIDMRDTTYIKLAIFGKKTKTDFADANNDGKVSMLDVGQTNLIILGKEKQLTIVDTGSGPVPGAGKRIVTINKPVERIIALSDEIADAIRVLGAEDKVVGVGSDIKEQKRINCQVFYPVMSKLPSVGTMWGFNLDYEAMLTLNPDVILMRSSDRPVEEIIDKMEKVTGAKVGCFGIYFPLLVREDFDKLGYILDKRSEAKEFTDFYEGIMNKIIAWTEGLPEADKPRVYSEARHAKMVTHSKESRQGQLLTIAGGINMAADLTGQANPQYPKVDEEWILVQNPDIIIKYCWDTGYHTDDQTGIIAAREEIMSRPGWKNLKAVKNGDVSVLAYEPMDGPQVFVLVSYLAKIFHPELFKDLDPEAIHQEYLDRFQRIDYDLDEHGVFVYPEPS